MKRAFDEHTSILLELRDSGFDFVRDTPQFQVLAQPGKLYSLPLWRREKGHP